MSKEIPLHSDLVRFEYECDELNGVVLTCFLDYEEEEVGSVDGYGLKNEPDYPETWSLVHAYTPEGLDIGGVLHPDVVESIEELAGQYSQEGGY